MSDTAPPYPPPRNVVYFRHATNLISLAGIANLPYTDVIVGFLIPGSIGLTGDGPAFIDTQTLQNNIQLLQSAGKNVLISVGGEVSNKPNWTGWSSPKYKLYSDKVPALVKQIVSGRIPLARMELTLISKTVAHLLAKPAMTALHFCLS